MNTFKLFLLKTTRLGVSQILCRETNDEDYASENEALNAALFILKTSSYTTDIKAVVLNIGTGRSQVFPVRYTPAQYHAGPG